MLATPPVDSDRKRSTYAVTSTWVSVRHSWPDILEVDDGGSGRGIFLDMREACFQQVANKRSYQLPLPYPHSSTTRLHRRILVGTIIKEFRHGSPLHLREENEFGEYQQQQEVPEAIEEKEDGKKKQEKKRWHPVEIEIDSDNEDDINPQPAKQQELSSLFPDDSPTPTHEQSPRHSFKHIAFLLYLRPRSPSPWVSADSSQHPSITTTATHVWLLTTIPSKCFAYGAGTVAEHQELPFKSFIKRAGIGSNNSEFRLQHVSKHFHLTILSEALNVGSNKLKLTSIKASTPCNILHSKPRLKRTRDYSQDEGGWFAPGRVFMMSSRIELRRRFRYNTQQTSTKPQKELCLGVMDQYTWNFNESVPQHLAQELNQCV
ncbi:hypothetical protein CJF30_00007453 [Rutstroemia sp. NJR-2017a BBW]|nr:hypothetical protein CJF30_00007453 [Rutstroemia sp. NJR-2017a BBW]